MQGNRMTLQEEVEEVFVAADILPPSPPPLLLIEPLPPPVYTKTSFTLWPLELIVQTILTNQLCKVYLQQEQYCIQC